MRPFAALTQLVPMLSMALLSSAALAAEGQEGMPQLNFATPLTLAQVVWLGVIFLALYLLLANWALPKVGEVLEMRAGLIAQDLDAARGAKAEADAAVAELTAATRQAQQDAQSQIGTAVAAAKEAAATQAAEANAQLAARLAASESQIADARQSAMGALREVASSTAADVVARLTGQITVPAAIDHAVDQVMAARLHA